MRHTDSTSLITGSLYLLSLLTVLGLGATHLYMPFGPDQAVVFAGALSLADGGQLYVDYWDNKQPGLYWFYWLAGELFGFSETAVHLLELMWLTGLSLLLLSLRRYLTLPLLATLLPVACVASYYATSTEYELTQLEMLVSLPIFVGLLCLIKGEQENTRTTLWWFCGGLAAGVLAVFKLLLSPIFLLFGVWLCWSAWRQGSGLADLLLKRLIPAILGGLTIVASVLWLFWSQGNLDELLWTSLEYPPLAISSAPPASVTRLITATAFFSQFTLIWLPFVGFSLWMWLRGNTPKVIQLTWIWLLAMMAFFLIQRFSWWQYHTLLFLVPYGILGVFGLDAMLKAFFPANANRQPLLAGVCLFVFAASLFGPFVKRAEILMHHKLVSGKGLHGFQQKVSEQFGKQYKSSAFVRRHSALPGPIYVFGNPSVYRYAERDVAHPIVGSSWEYYLPEQIEDILSTLLEKQVPYVFVGIEDDKIFAHSPRISRFLREHYWIIRRDEAGKWFVLNTLEPPP